MFPPEFKMWCVDTVMNLFFKELDRKYHFDEMYIEHISYHTKAREFDSINHHVQNVSNSCIPPDNMSYYFDTISRYIKND